MPLNRTDASRVGMLANECDVFAQVPTQQYIGGRDGLDLKRRRETPLEKGRTWLCTLSCRPVFTRILFISHPTQSSSDVTTNYLAKYCSSGIARFYRHAVWLQAKSCSSCLLFSDHRRACLRQTTLKAALPNNTTSARRPQTIVKSQICISVDGA